MPILVCFLLLQALAVPPAPAQYPDGAILLDEPYAYPPLAELSDLQHQYLTNYYTPEEYAAAMRPVLASGFELRNIWYASEGLRVLAYVYRPRNLPAKPLPAIIYNRGSGPMGDQGFVFAPFFHRLAQEGFVVIAPQYRGGAGAEGVDEVGGRDVADVLNVGALAGNLGYVDTENLFMYGESRGGMMTFQAIRRQMPLGAAATFGGFTDLEQTVAATPWVDPRQVWPDWEARREEIVRARSAIEWAETLDVPLLLMHGGADRQVSPAQSLRLALRLEELGRTYELVIYAGDGHVLKLNQEDRDRRAIAWFRRHLKTR